MEFVLTLILFLSFVFFYFQLSMIFAFGNYVHYATFMSARAYQAAGGTLQDQKDRATDVIIMTLKKSVGQSGLDKFASIGKGIGGGDVKGLEIDPPTQYNPDDRSYSWLQGVRYTFRSKLFMIPLAGLSKPAKASIQSDSVNALVLTAESWLGKEPSWEECVNYMNGELKGAIFDNGC